MGFASQDVAIGGRDLYDLYLLFNVQPINEAIV